MTLKLQKLWQKYGEAKSDLDGAWSQWAAEKEEMLDSVRMLQQQLTLKDLVIQAFIPQEDVQKVFVLQTELTCRSTIGAEPSFAMADVTVITAAFANVNASSLLRSCFTFLLDAIVAS